jgi:hypothetical protein
MLELGQRRVDCLKIEQAKLRSPVGFDGAFPYPSLRRTLRIATTLLSGNLGNEPGTRRVVAPSARFGLLSPPHRRDCAH